MIETGAYLKLTGFVELSFLCYSRYETEKMGCVNCVYFIICGFNYIQGTKDIEKEISCSEVKHVGNDNKNNLVLYGIS